MQILSTSELEAFDRPPILNYRERKRSFDLPKSLMDIVTELRIPTSQVGFLLMCGYFKATKRFYSPQDFHAPDIEAAAKLMGLSDLDFSPDAYPKQTRARHRRLILDFYGFMPFDRKAEEAVAAEIATMARTHLKPRLIFDRCIDYLIQRRVQLPRAGVLLELIRAGLQARKMELIELMDTHLTDEARALMDDLFTTANNQNRYRLTLLKKLSQSTKPTKIKEAITDYKTLSTLYGQIEETLTALNLGVAGIRYYAGSVLRSEMFQIRRRTESDRYIHAAAFVGHQFYRTQDNLIDLWLSVMASFQAKATREHNELLIKGHKKQQDQLSAVVNDLDSSVFSLLRDIRRVTETGDLSDAQKVSTIRSLLDKEKPSEFKRLKDELAETGKDGSWFDVIETQSLRLQNRLSPILRVIKFDRNEGAISLINAIDYFQNRDGSIATGAPVGFLNADEQVALTRADGTFRPSLYKVFLFQHVTAAIKSGHLNLSQSYKYRPMDAYLISSERWEQDKQDLLARAGLSGFTDPAPVLATLRDALARQYQCTNGNAAVNPHLKVRSDDVFHVSTPAVESDDTSSTSDLFPQRHDVPLAQVLETINNHCGMLGQFEHWRQTHIRDASASRPALLAGIMGLGCGIGVRKMARISSQVTESELEYAVNWRFSLDNIRAANDTVVKAMDEMKLPNIYRQDTEMLHTASDGQKFEVRGESLAASRSFKYFGQGQGVSAYTFVDERHFLWHSLMISAADRESAYVIDGLMCNDVVKSDIHSTDSHGYTEAIFGLTHLLGFSFAPRIKGVGKQTLYIFKPRDRSEEQGWVIKPDKTINERLILDNWDFLLRLVTTIKLKENTASDIFRRLNSYSRQHALYQTIKAFGQIIKSLFILRYVDDLELRQAIERQLNKVELANRFTRAVAVGNPREFSQEEKDEQEIAEACNRLIKNSIICWNYLYLTRQLEKAPDTETRENLIRSIAAHAPMAWAHINMLGEYDFSDEKLRDTLGILPLISVA
ncbi:Tn3 family transposase [Dongshaea marina]|uniref:Tn3 family transposase n=1 Tax=Dongshaea marina TaxID=2047966 RepID=UPI000D3E54E9|nr:Tn3 family transposase [Dongshaea marina]